MADLFDTASVPDDPQHWDALAVRIAAHASRQSEVTVFGWLASSPGSLLAACLLLGAALALALLPSESFAAKNRSVEWAKALAPTDEVGRAIILTDSPPAVGALLLAPRGRT